MELIVSARHVSKSFRGSGGEEEVVVDNLNLDIHSGEFIAILGTSGVGKTTLVKLLSGLQQPSSGRVSYFSHSHNGEARELSPREAIRNGTVSLLFQRPVLAHWRTVMGNLMLPMEIRTPVGISKRDKASELLHMVGLSESDGCKLPSQLSGGMQQRLALAMLLSYDPQVLFLDEPFGALDAVTRRQMQGLLLSLWNSGGSSTANRTVVFVTHDVNEAIFLADRVFVVPSKPVSSLESIEVKLDRPRDHSILYESAVRDMAEHAFEVMSNEGILPKTRLASVELGQKG